MTTRQLALDLPLAPSYAREDFVGGEANRAALQWIDRWPDWPGPRRGLVVFGPEGAGKTHLVSLWLARCGGRRIAAAALPAAESAAPVDAPLAVEDVDAGVDEAAFLHLYNRAMEAQSGLVVTGRGPVASWPVRLPDLRSRLLALPAVAVAAPDDALLAAVLAKLFADRQLKVEERVLAFLLPRMERSYAAARLLVAAIDRISLEARRDVTLPLASEALRRLEEM